MSLLRDLRIGGLPFSVQIGALILMIRSLEYDSGLSCDTRHSYAGKGFFRDAKL